MAPRGGVDSERFDPVTEPDRVLDALDDPTCRRLLRATGETALSASELSERCDVPLSTTYRKLELLTEVGLLDERIRIRRSGKHTSEYRRRVDDVLVSVHDDGLDVHVSSDDGADRAGGPAGGSW